MAGDLPRGCIGNLGADLLRDSPPEAGALLRESARRLCTGLLRQRLCCGRRFAVLPTAGDA
eukprot:9304772-Lingulodinium_polyedra.AAC.1